MRFNLGKCRRFALDTKTSYDVTDKWYLTKRQFFKTIDCAYNFEAKKCNSNWSF